MLATGSFEEVARRMLGAPPEAVVSVDFEGGGEVQIGDMTWDTEPVLIRVEASIPGIVALAKRDPAYRKWRGKTWSRTFGTLPELWEAMTAWEDR